MHTPIQPNAMRNLWLICQFELVRLFQTTRGLVAIAAFAVVWYFILRYPIYQSAQFISSPNFAEVIEEMFGRFGLQQLTGWIVAEFVVFWLAALMLLPIFSMFISADQTSSDRERGTMRFLTLRASRDSIFFGRFLGQLLIQAILLSAVISATFVMTIYNNPDQWQQAINSALLIAVNLMIVSLPFTAMMALCSALVRSSKLALALAIISCGVGIGLVSYIVHHFPTLDFLFYLIPGLQIFELAASSQWSTFEYATLPLVQTVVLLIIGRTVINRSSL